MSLGSHHGLNPWANLRDVLTRLSARLPNDLSDIPPDRWQTPEHEPPTTPTIQGR